MHKTNWTRLLAPRLNALRFSPARQAEIIEELSQHLDDRVEELRQAGVPAPDAEQAAISEITDDALVQRLGLLRQAHAPEPIVAGASTRRLFPDLLQDLRYGWRSLRAQPAFSAAAILTLTLGIGANTAIFSLVNALLLQPMPFTDPSTLAWISNGPGAGGVFSYPAMAEVRDHNDVFSEVAAWAPIGVSLNASGDTDQILGHIVSGNYFPVLGTGAAAGRLLGPADDVTPGAHPVAAISYRLWQERFGGASDIIGREVLLNGQRFTIIGVVERRFRPPDGTARDVFVPMMMQAIARPPRAGFAGEMNPDLLNVRTNQWVFAIGRLKPGMTIGRAAPALSATVTALDRVRQASSPVHAISLFPMSEGVPGQRGQVTPVARLLFSIVGVVLLIACVNVANLMLSRAASRRREIAVRLAIGASRWRLIRQLLTESVLLATISGAGGVTLAWLIAAGFRSSPPPVGALPVGLEFALDYRVLFFTIGLSIATGLLFGLAPAIRASRPNVVPALKDDMQGPEGRRRVFHLRRLLVIAEVALSLVLIVAAGLFVRSLRETQAIEPGFDADRLINAPLNINLLRYTTTQGKEFYKNVVDRMMTIPGVEAASVARVQVLGQPRVSSLIVEGREGSTEIFQSSGGGFSTGRDSVFSNTIAPGYFQTLGIRLLQGRDFDANDASDHPPVVIVNKAFVAMHLLNKEALGRRVSFRGPTGPWHTIVGVVADAKYATLSEPFAPVAYVPLAQNHETGVVLHVRTAVAPDSLVSAVRREIQALEPNLPVPSIRTMSETIGVSLYAARMGAWAIGVLGGLSLLLATIGVYGVLASSVGRRARELGIRVALGANRRDILTMVLNEGLTLVIIGIVVGVTAAFYVATPLTRFLYGVASHDLLTFITAPVLLLVVGAIGCLVPARRAIRVQPTVALKT